MVFLCWVLSVYLQRVFVLTELRIIHVSVMTAMVMVLMSLWKPRYAGIEGERWRLVGERGLCFASDYKWLTMMMMMMTILAGIITEQSCAS